MIGLEDRSRQIAAARDWYRTLPPLPEPTTRGLWVWVDESNPQGWGPTPTAARDHAIDNTINETDDAELPLAETVIDIATTGRAVCLAGDPHAVRLAAEVLVLRCWCRINGNALERMNRILRELEAKAA